MNEKLDFALAGDLAPYLFGLRFFRVVPVLTAIVLPDDPVVMTARLDMDYLWHCRSTCTALCANNGAVQAGFQTRPCA